jgi:hypothetical protein
MSAYAAARSPSARGEHGLALAADADAILRALDASVADIPEPAA